MPFDFYDRGICISLVRVLNLSMEPLNYSHSLPGCATMLLRAIKLAKRTLRCSLVFLFSIILFSSGSFFLSPPPPSLHSVNPQRDRTSSSLFFVYNFFFALCTVFFTPLLSHYRYHFYPPPCSLFSIMPLPPLSVFVRPRPPRLTSVALFPHIQGESIKSSGPRLFVFVAETVLRINSLRYRSISIRSIKKSKLEKAGMLL